MSQFEDISMGVEHERNENILPRSILLSIGVVNTNLLVRESDAKVRAIVDEDGRDRHDTIVENLQTDRIVADALEKYFREKEVAIVIQQTPDSSDDNQQLSLNTEDINKAILAGNISIYRDNGSDSYKIENLDEQIRQFCKEHAFDRKYNPEIEVE